MAVMNQFDRTERILGKSSMDKLIRSKVSLVGLGAVGGAALEILARMGIGEFVLIDHDEFEISNLNRQVLSLHSTIGRKKTDVAKERVLDINPNAAVTVHDVFLDESRLGLLDNPDIIIDCIDSVKSKVALLTYAYNRHIPAVSSMGAACRMKTESIEAVDISETHSCPLAREVRKGLRMNGIESGIKCVFSPYSEHIPVSQNESDGKRIPLPSLPAVTFSFGIKVAEAAVDILLKK